MFNIVPLIFRQCVNAIKGNTCPVCGVPSYVKDVQRNRQLDTAATLCQQLANLLTASEDGTSHQSSCVLVSWSVCVSLSHSLSLSLSLSLSVCVCVCVCVCKNDHCMLVMA